jgi:hypothetical protein
MPSVMIVIHHDQFPGFLSLLLSLMFSSAQTVETQTDKVLKVQQVQKQARSLAPSDYELFLA